MRHVFISYSRKDQEYANQLEKEIQSYGIPVWIDSHIQVGDVWAKEIQTALVNSFAVVVIMTPSSAQSDWVLRELEWAERNKDIQILPLLLRECDFLALNIHQHEDVQDQKMPSTKFFTHLSHLYKMQSEPIDPVIEVKRLRQYVEALEDRVYELESELEEINFWEEERMHLEWGAEEHND